MLFTLEEQADAEELYERTIEDPYDPFCEEFQDVWDDFKQELAEEYVNQYPEKMIALKVLAMRKLNEAKKRRECSGS